MRAIQTVAVALLVGGCALFDDEPRDRYVLETLAGQDLPATLSSIETVDGHTVDFKLTSGSLILFDGGRMEIASRLEEVWDGVVRHVSQDRPSSGSYQRTEAEMTIRFTDAEGLARVFTYSIIDGGRALRGVQWDHEAEYVRR